MCRGATSFSGTVPLVICSSNLLLEALRSFEPAWLTSCGKAQVEFGGIVFSVSHMLRVGQ